MKNGWHKRSLGQLCELISGRHINAKDYNTKSHGIGYLTGPSDFGPINPIVSKWTEHPIVKARTGDILITVKGSGVGKINLLDLEEVAISRQLMAIRVKEADPRFVHLYLASTFDHFQSLSTGAAIPGISREQVLGLEIATPPLAEQRRIVGILDEAFAGIAAAKANAEKNLQNARDLFDSHLNSVCNQRGDGWVDMRVGDIVARLTNGYVGPTRNIYQNFGVPYLLARHVRDNRLSFDGKTYVSPAFNQKNKKSMLKANDVLLVQSGHIGHSAVVPAEHEGHNCHAMIVITPIDAKITGPFLSFCFNSTTMQAKFQSIRSGSTVPHLTCAAVKELVVPVPSLNTQRQLVAHCEDLRGETQRLESLYQRKLAALNELKKSLLHQAFSGQL